MSGIKIKPEAKSSRKIATFCFLLSLPSQKVTTNFPRQRKMIGGYKHRLFVCLSVLFFCPVYTFCIFPCLEACESSSVLLQSRKKKKKKEREKEREENIITVVLAD